MVPEKLISAIAWMQSRKTINERVRINIDTHKAILYHIDERVHLIGIEGGADAEEG